MVFRSWMQSSVVTGYEVMSSFLRREKEEDFGCWIPAFDVSYIRTSPIPQPRPKSTRTVSRKHSSSGKSILLAPCSRPLVETCTLSRQSTIQPQEHSPTPLKNALQLQQSKSWKI